MMASYFEFMGRSRPGPSDTRDPRRRGCFRGESRDPVDRPAMLSLADSARTRANPADLSYPKMRPHPPGESRGVRMPADERANHSRWSLALETGARSGAP